MTRVVATSEITEGVARLRLDVEIDAGDKAQGCKKIGKGVDDGVKAVQNRIKGGRSRDAVDGRTRGSY